MTLTMATGSASGQPRGKSKKAARAHFKAGQKQFQDKQYSQALRSFKKANKLLPHPDILFMVAQCHRNLKHYKKAIKAYQGYLKSKPQAEDKAQVTRLIEELQFLDEVSPEPDEPDEPDEPVEPDDPTTKKPATTPDKDPPTKPLVTPTPPVVPIAPGPRRTKKTPVYKKWWFWAIVGTVVVAGSVTGGVLASDSGGDPPAGSLGTLDLR